MMFLRMLTKVDGDHMDGTLASPQMFDNVFSAIIGSKNRAFGFTGKLVARAKQGLQRRNCFQLVTLKVRLGVDIILAMFMPTR